jgi:hypothetical protein
VSTDDKAYTTEQRLNALWNHLGPVPAGTGNGQARTYWTAGTQNVTSTTRADITGITGIPVVAGGSYEFSGIICGQQGPVAAGQVVSWDGPVLSFGRVFTETNAQGNTSVTDSDLTGALPWIHTTPAWGNGVIFYVRFRGFFTVSSGTAFKMQAAEGTNLDTWVIAAASLLTIESVAQTS